MYNKWLVRGLALVIALAVVVAGCSAWDRYKYEYKPGKDPEENVHNELEMAVVFDEVQDLGELYDREALSLLPDLQGVTTVLFKEDTPSMLEDRGEFDVVPGPGVDGETRQRFPDGEFQPDHTYLFTADKNNWQRVAANLRAKGLPANTYDLGGNNYVISTPLSVERMEQWGLGFPVEEMSRVAAAGFNVMVQIRTWPGVDQRQIENVFEPLQDWVNENKGSLSGILFNDEQLPGFGGEHSKILLGVLAEEIKDLNAPLVQIEFTAQKGFNNLARVLDKQVVRLHTISEREIGRYNPGEALDRFELAATDRNMRILLVRFFTAPEYDWLQYNSSFFAGLKESLAEEGFTFGRASLLPSLNDFTTLPRTIFIIGLGGVAGGMLLALRLFPRRAAIILGIAGFLGWTAVIIAGSLNPELLTLARKLGALAAVIIFPTLAVMWGVSEKGLPPLQAVLRFVQTSLFSLVGAVLMVGLLADLGFMLKLDQFAGVKAAHIIPLALLAGYFFFTVPRDENWVRRMVRTAKNPVTVGLLAASGILAGVLLVYVMRTGNTDMGAVLPFEQQFRTYLENALAVRPRTKEFLLGHPLLLLLLFTGYRDARFMPLLVLGAIGQVSMVNTFAHIHTPLAISLFRSFNGLWLGILGGLILIGLWQLGMSVWRRLET